MRQDALDFHGPFTPQCGERPAPPLPPTAGRSRLRLLFLIVLALLTLLSLPLLADTRSALCEASAREASARTGVPLSVLRGLMFTESGRKIEGHMQPWPWTVSAAGRHVWFETADDARAFAYQQIKSGERSLALGCFGLNYSEHEKGFASLEDMFNPGLNASFAAVELARRAQTAGGWGAAVATWRPLPPDEAKAYLDAFYRFRNSMRGQDPAVATAMATGPSAPRPPAEPRSNSFPLLVSSQAPPSLGSLVPVSPAPASAGLFNPQEP